MKVQSITSCYVSCGPNIDSEEKEIMRRLMAYGITPTGNKTTDKATLRRIELEKAKESNTILPDLLTVSRQEQEEIQKKKKIKKKEQIPEYNTEKFEGSKAMGEQIFLAINMKKKTTTS